MRECLERYETDRVPRVTFQLPAEPDRRAKEQGAHRDRTKGEEDEYPEPGEPAVAQVATWARPILRVVVPHARIVHRPALHVTMSDTPATGIPRDFTPGTEPKWIYHSPTGYWPVRANADGDVQSDSSLVSDCIPIAEEFIRLMSARTETSNTMAVDRSPTAHQSRNSQAGSQEDESMTTSGSWIFGTNDSGLSPKLRIPWTPSSPCRFSSRDHRHPNTCECTECFWLGIKGQQAQETRCRGRAAKASSDPARLVLSDEGGDVSQLVGLGEKLGWDTVIERACRDLEG